MLTGNESAAKISRMELKERLYRRRYLVPNLVTLGNMFCGFLAIIYASSDRFEKAAIAILVAIILDGLDGRVARRLNATSQFGLEFDSFSDLVSFGVAPAILVYNWAFKVQADEFGVLIAFLFALSSASRLARFNISQESLTSFQGLPTPGAAGMVIAAVYMLPQAVTSRPMIGLVSVIMVLIALLSVSNIAYPSIKQMKIRNLGPQARLLLGALIVLIWWKTRIGLLVLASIYVLSGPLAGAARRFFPKKISSSKSRPTDQAAE